eukprot:1192384-Prorocentrum_minimum.AAC.2
MQLQGRNIVYGRRVSVSTPYSLPPSAIGARYRYILSPLPRLVPATAIFSPPFRDWCPLRVLRSAVGSAPAGGGGGQLAEREAGGAAEAAEAATAKAKAELETLASEAVKAKEAAEVRGAELKEHQQVRRTIGGNVEFSSGRRSC